MGGMTLESLAGTDTAADLVAIEIRARLAVRRISQAALARDLGEGPMWVSDRLNGRVQMTVNDMARIADALDLKLVDLLPRTLGGNGAYSPTHTLPHQGRASAQVATALGVHTTPIPGWRGAPDERRVSPIPLQRV